jgi:hypothetical protein
MNAQLGQQVRIVDSEKVSETLFVAHVSWVYENGGFIAQYGANEIRFTKNGIQYGKGGRYNGQKILYAYLVA